MATPAYGESTPPRSLSAASDSALASEVVTGLEAGTTYHVRAVAENATDTSYGDDQAFFASGADVDLVMTAVSGPGEAALGTLVSLSATVLNQGTVSAEEFRTSIYLSENPLMTGPSRNCAKNPIIGGLLGGESRNELFSCRVPFDLDPGTYYWVAVADDDGRVAEGNEGNNSLAGGTVELTQADLVVSSVSGPSAAAAYDTIDVSTTVENVGDSSTAVGGTIAIYLSEDTVIDASDTLLGTLPFPEISPGQSHTQSYSVGVVFDTPRGRYWVGAVVDSTGVVLESDETNNSAAAPNSTRVK